MSDPAVRALAGFYRQTRHRLCSRLLDLPDMTSTDRRDFLMRQLTVDFPGMRATPRNDNPNIDLMEIVSSAYDYPGALQALLEVVEYVYAPDGRITAIRALIDAIDPVQLLKPDERAAAEHALESVDTSTVAAAFRRSAGCSVEDVGVDPADPAAVVRWLEDLVGRPDEPHPLFQFIMRLAQSLDDDHRILLLRWLAEVGGRLDLDPSELDQLRAATDGQPGAGRLYIVAELRPDRLRPDRYFLAAWRQHGTDPEEALYQSDRSIGADEAITIVGRLMRGLGGSADTTEAECVLELIVPRRLVTEPLDQWMVDSLLPAPIGTEYPVMLRSFERLDDSSMHAAWARNWRWLKQHQNAGQGQILYAGSHELADVQLLRGALLRDGPPTVVVMQTPLPVSDGLRVDAYTAALRGGAPVMVWSRQESTAAEVAEHVEVACRQDLQELPSYIFELRLRGLVDPTHAPVGSSISLVWDDFDRIPERFRSRARLRTPSQGG